jgi:hypothetical protein
MGADFALAVRRPCKFIRRWTLSRELSQNGMQRSRNPIRTKCSAAVQNPSHSVHPGPSDRSFARHKVHCRISDRRYGGARQSKLVETLAQPLIVGWRPFENRDLDPVKSGCTDVRKQRIVLGADSRRPKEHAHSDLHDSASCRFSSGLTKIFLKAPDGCATPAVFHLVPPKNREMASS